MRNTRLATIESFFRYLEYRVPGCLDLALQVRAIPHKRADKPLVAWLDRSEMQAVLGAPDTSTALGLRVSELTALTLGSLSHPRLESIHILGKVRRERELPLWNGTRTVLSGWLEVRPSVGNRDLLPNACGRALSRDGFAYRLDLPVAAAGRAVPSLAAKRVTPHVLRQSTAMTILHAKGDIRKVSLWLGYADMKTTELYLRASPAEKLEILEANTPPSIRPGKLPGALDSLMRLLNGK